MPGINLGYLQFKWRHQGNENECLFVRMNCNYTDLFKNMDPFNA